MPIPRRLIEVDLPIGRISAHARREKTTRANPLSRLHTWWARKPLAACRAVLCAALWPDPVDADCPAAFIRAAKSEMLAIAKGHLAQLSPQTFERFSGFQKNPKLLEQPEVLRATLLDFIADFADPINITRPPFLECARRLTGVAHKALAGASERPLVADPFAGGGSIPLEALRLQADAFATDLNPVAVFLNKITGESVPRHGPLLEEEVRRWGAWMVGEARKRLARLHPSDPDGAKPVAWLWVRTIECEGPRCGAVIPLRHTMWLARKGRRAVALQLCPRPRDRRIDITVLQDPSPRNVGEGTVKRGSVTCPVCGFTTPVASVREQMRRRHGGTRDARLACVVTKRPNSTALIYREPTQADFDALSAAQRQADHLLKKRTDKLAAVPDEPLPPQGTLGFRVQRYGMENWGELFSARQQVVLLTLVDLLQEVREQVTRRHAGSTDLAAAVCSVLALAVDRQADFGNALCRWAAASEDAKQLFGRQAVPMMWDYAEANPIDADQGTFPGFIEGVCSALTRLGSDWRVGQVEAASATSQLLPDGTAHCIFTDPPYYDAIPYADLSDFFYVWLRRTAGPSYPALFSTPLTPKDVECILDVSKGKDRTYFESIMSRAMQECRRVLAPGGIGVVVFAHKSTGGWEAQLQAMVDAGWTITGSWPIDTELGSRLRAMNSAVLSSSIHLVCRPRELTTGLEAVGDWKRVLSDLTLRVHSWMPRLAGEGVVGADAIFACLGPALEVFSRYDRVEKANGDSVSMKDFLEHVWATVSREALDMIFKGADASGFEEDARLTAMWLWTLSSTIGAGSIDSDDEDDDAEDGPSAGGRGGGYLLEFDAARKIAQGLGAHLEQLSGVVQIQGQTARLLGVGERRRLLLGDVPAATDSARPRKHKQLELFEGFAPASSGEPGSRRIPSAGRTVLDRVHQAMLLFGDGLSDAVKRFLLEDGVGREARFWRLAQALSALYPPGTDEKRWVDGVLARKRGLGL